MSAATGSLPADTRGRDAAIEASGWGRPFRFVQWRNAAFWVYLFAMVAGAVSLVRFYGPGIGVYGVGLGSGVLLFSLYAIPWLLLLSHHNRYTSLPPAMLLVAFLWGAVPATYWIALRANTAALSLYGKLFGNAWVHDWGAGLTAPFTEETAKALALVLLIGMAPRLVRSPYDGLVIGAFAGLGLQLSEDVLYAFNATTSNFGADQVGSAWGIFVGRAAAGIVSHALFSAVFCSGLMWLLGRAGPRRAARGLLLMAAAVLAHSSWDNMAAYGNALDGGAGTILLMIVIAAAELVLLWLTFRLAAPQEQGWIRAILAPEARTGVLTDEEVRAAGGDRRTRRAYRRSVRGRAARRSARHVLAAAHDLAQALARGGGRDTAEVVHARAEIARLRSRPGEPA